MSLLRVVGLKVKRTQAEEMKRRIEILVHWKIEHFTQVVKDWNLYPSCMDSLLTTGKKKKKERGNERENERE